MSAPRDIAIEISSRLVLDLSDDQIERIAQIIQRVVSRPAAPASADVPGAADLAAIRARCEAATVEAEREAKRKPGFCAGGVRIPYGNCTKCGHGAHDGCPYDTGNPAAVEFAKHARTDIPALLSALTDALAEGSKHLDDVLMLQGFCDDRDKRIATLTQQLSDARAALKPINELPVSNEELQRISNRADLADASDVRIWGKMLYMLVNCIRECRAAQATAGEKEG